jgi:hypothetical protein
MTRMDQKALGEIESLMEERQKYEQWINSLGDRRSITPGHVFQRVLGDYQQRMTEVAQNLAARAGDIQASIGELRGQLATLQDEEGATTDERAEAELRAAVGEYTQDKWEEVRKVADENISRLSALRVELSGELTHLERILAVALPGTEDSNDGTAGGDGAALSSAGGASATVGGAAVSAGQGATAAADSAATGAGDSAARKRTDSAPDTASNAPRGRPPAADDGAGKPGQFDELAFLSSVVEAEIKHMPTQAADLAAGLEEERPSTPARPISVQSDESMDRAMRAAPTPASSRIVRSATPLITESLGASKEKAEIREDNARAMFDRRLSGSVPAYLKDVGKEATKSLKCQECGTMNYPTEWYCERCGGELAAL